MFFLSSLCHVIDISFPRGRSNELGSPFPFKCSICYKSWDLIQGPVSDLWTRVQTPSLWLSSVENLRESHLSSLSFHFLKLSHRGTPHHCAELLNETTDVDDGQSVWFPVRHSSTWKDGFCSSSSSGTLHLHFHGWGLGLRTWVYR